MAVGIIAPTVFTMIYFILDMAAHAENRSLQCMFSFDTDDDINPASWSKIATFIYHYYHLFYDVHFNVITLASYTYYRVALYEFICSQSPHSMKGLLIGVSFAVEGLFDLLCILFVFVFHYSWKTPTFPSCCMTYYLIIVFVGLVALSLYVFETRGYQYRMRDEPCHVHRYVEEYYSKIQEEKNY